MIRPPRPGIDGNTLIFATPGKPVAQIRLPQVMDAVFAALGINAVWLPMEVEREGLATVLQGLRTIDNFRGITVAIPYKPVIPAMLDRVSRAAETAGAVNIVRREADGALLGDMVDGAGFVRGLARQGLSARGAAAWLVGAGGGGAAIAAALAEAGLGKLYLTELDAARAGAVLERLARFFPRLETALVSEPPEPVGLAINATPLGLAPGDRLPFDPTRLASATVVCDIVMKPRETALLRAAQERGLRVQHGHHMLDAQIPMYLSFLGLASPDEDRVTAIASRA
jgi:shikimate dehydrogenase